MAIDVGTGSCRAAIFEATGRQISISQHEWSHRTLAGFSGSQVFDTVANWKLISHCVRNSIEKAGINASSIQAVSATSMREGMVLYDSSGREIWACPNVDSRARKEARYLVRRRMADKIFKISGDWVSITSPSRFLWIKKHEPETFKKIAHVGMLSDWVIHKLCGEFVTDPSAGSSSGMFDLSKRTWSEELIALCGLDAGIFPEVSASGSVKGGVNSIASKDTGLELGTPVVLGGADTQLGLVGLGVTRPHQLTLLGGSFWQLTALLDKPITDPKIRLRTLCHVIPERWMIEGIGFYSGLTMRWFRDAFCEKEKEEASRLSIEPYELMEKEASSVPVGSGGVIGIFSNIMNSKKWTHASPAFLQFNVTRPLQSGKKECIRAIEEASAYAAFGHLKIIQSLMHARIKDITFAGGASKGLLWPKIVSDVLGVKVNVPSVKESTALGAAICAGVGAGFYKSIDDAGRKLAHIERTFEPSAQNHEKYNALFERWQRIYSESLRLTDEGLLNPMWRGA